MITSNFYQADIASIASLPIEESLGGIDIVSAEARKSQPSVTPYVESTKDWEITPGTSSVFTSKETSREDLVWKDFSIVTTQQLDEQIRNYEEKFGLSSEEFFKKWQRGEIADTWETNLWADLFLYRESDYLTIR